LVGGSILLTESFCKKYLFSVTSLLCTLVNPFVAVHPTHILVHPRVHRAHRLKVAGIVYNFIEVIYFSSLEKPPTVYIISISKQCVKSRP